MTFANEAERQSVSQLYGSERYPNGVILSVLVGAGTGSIPAEPWLPREAYTHVEVMLPNAPRHLAETDLTDMFDPIGVFPNNDRCLASQVSIADLTAIRQHLRERYGAPQARYGYEDRPDWALVPGDIQEVVP